MKKTDAEMQMVEELGFPFVYYLGGEGNGGGIGFPFVYYLAVCVFLLPPEFAHQPRLSST